MKFSDVRKIVLEMEDVEEGSSYGTPAFKIHGVLFVRHRPELDSIVVAMDQEERAAAIEEEPETYYLTDHYVDYPWVLVRLLSVKPITLRDLLQNAKKFVETNHKKRASKKRTRR